MAQTKGLVNLLKVKIANITSQKDHLFGVLDNYVHRVTSKASESIETKVQDVKALREISSTMDTVWEYLLEITTHIEDESPSQEIQTTGLPPAATATSSSLPAQSPPMLHQKSHDSDETPSQEIQTTGLPPAATATSSSLPAQSPPMLHQKSHDSDSDEMSKIHQRLEVLESGLTACRNEMSQTTTQITQAKDQLDTRCLNLEEKLQHLVNENQETKKEQVAKFAAVGVKINHFHIQCQDYEERLLNLLDDLKVKMDGFSTRLQNYYEKLAVPGRVGFTAYIPRFWFTNVPRQGSRITDFTDVLYDEGNHYNSSTGEFFCPVDGLFVVSTTLRQLRGGTIGVDIKRRHGVNVTEVCRAWTDKTMTSCCGVAVVRLQEGDRVYVEVTCKSGNPEMDGFSSFSCFQIG